MTNALLGMADYLRRGPGVDTALSWAADPPMVPEQRGTLVPGLIPQHVSGTHPKPELAWPGLLHDPYVAMKRLFDAGAAERAGQAPPAPSDAYISQPSPSHTGFGLIPLGNTRTPWLTQEGQNARDAFDVAGLATTGGLIAPKPAQALGIFGGRLAKTADHSALARAEDMWARGVPREDVWRETGWFRGVDGKPRFEIDDSGMKPRSPETWARPWKTWNGAEWALEEPSVGTALGQGANRLTGERGLFNHQALADAYPDVAGIRVGASNGSAGGSYVHARNGKPAHIELRHDLDHSDAASVALHEAQHAAQNKEGFAGGSAMMGWGDDAHKSYWNTSGEVEARAVQARRDLTPDQRSARPPWLDYDVPEAQQIVRGVSSNPTESASVPMFGGRVAQDIASLGPTQPHSGPVRAYHGTYADFDKFRSGNSLGPHFGTPEHATNILGRGEIEDGARIIPVEINAKKVAETTDHANWVPRSVASELEDLYPDLVGKLKPRLSSQSGVSSYAMRDINSKELREALVENGYDALRYQNEHEGDGGWSYIALKPGTVRSATTGEVLFSNPENAASVPLATQLAHQEHQMPGIIAYHGSPHETELDRLLNLYGYGR